MQRKDNDGECTRVSAWTEGGARFDPYGLFRRLCGIQRPVSTSMHTCRLCSETHPDPFRPVAAIPVDMFPHTLHCEAVVLLARQSVFAETREAFNKKRKSILELALLEEPYGDILVREDTPTVSEEGDASTPSSSQRDAIDDEERKALVTPLQTPPSGASQASSTYSPNPLLQSA